MKVKVFSFSDEEYFEGSINNWLEINSDKDILDKQYSTCCNQHGAVKHQLLIFYSEPVSLK